MRINRMKAVVNTCAQNLITDSVLSQKKLQIHCLTQFSPAYLPNQWTSYGATSPAVADLLVVRTLQ